MRGLHLSTILLVVASATVTVLAQETESNPLNDIIGVVQSVANDIANLSEEPSTTAASSARDASSETSASASAGSASLPSVASTSASARSISSSSARSSSNSATPSSTSSASSASSSMSLSPSQTSASSSASAAAASSTAAAASSGLSDRNKTIIIAVCTVVGVLLLGILIGLLCCCLRRRKRRSRRVSTPDTEPMTGRGDWEKHDTSHHGFSHWNGRRIESYTPIKSNNHVPLDVPNHSNHSTYSPRPDDADHPAFRNSASSSASAGTNRNSANPFVPPPPGARKAVGSPPQARNGAAAAALGGLAGAAAARHHEKNKRDDKSYHEYHTGFEEQPLAGNQHTGMQEHQPLNGYGAHQEHQPLGDHGMNHEHQGPTAYGVDHEQEPLAMHGAHQEQQPLNPYNDNPNHTPAARDPDRPPTPFGLAAFGASKSPKRHSHGAIEPSVADHSHQYPNHHLSASNYSPITSSDSQANTSHSSAAGEITHPTEAQRRSLHERDMMSPERQVLINPAVPERSPHRASFLEASNRGSTSTYRGSASTYNENSPLVRPPSPTRSTPPQAPLQSHPPAPSAGTAPTYPTDSSQNPQSPISPTHRNRASFSQPRPKFLSESRNSSNESYGTPMETYSTPMGEAQQPSWVLSVPQMPWEQNQRSSGDSKRSFGPDGRPRRMRASDEGWGVGRAM